MNSIHADRTHRHSPTGSTGSTHTTQVKFTVANDNWLVSLFKAIARLFSNIFGGSKNTSPAKDLSERNVSATATSDAPKTERVVRGGSQVNNDVRGRTPSPKGNQRSKRKRPATPEQTVPATQPKPAAVPTPAATTTKAAQPKVVPNVVVQKPVEVEDPSKENDRERVVKLLDNFDKYFAQEGVRSLKSMDKPAQAIETLRKISAKFGNPENLEAKIKEIEAKMGEKFLELREALGNLQADYRTRLAEAKAVVATIDQKKVTNPNFIKVLQIVAAASPEDPDTLITEGLSLKKMALIVAPDKNLDLVKAATVLLQLINSAKEYIVKTEQLV